MSLSNIELNKDTLFYDAQCPICAKEISRLQQLSGGHINFFDINKLEDAQLHTEGLSKAELYNELHLRTENGQWLTGIHANVRAWRFTPFATIIRLLEHPLILPFSTIGYQLWLKYYQAQRRKRLGKNCENSCDRR